MSLIFVLFAAYIFCCDPKTSLAFEQQKNKDDFRNIYSSTWNVMQGASSDAISYSCKPDDPECGRSSFQEVVHVHDPMVDERQRRRCESCLNSYKCSKLKNCENCDRICKENNINLKASNTVEDADELNLENFDVYYTLSEFGPGFQMDQIANLLNLEDKEKYEKIVILGKSLSKQPEKNCRALLVDEVDSFNGEINGKCSSINNNNLKKIQQDQEVAESKKITTEINKNEDKSLGNAIIVEPSELIEASKKDENQEEIKVDDNLSTVHKPSTIIHNNNQHSRIRIRPLRPLSNIRHRVGSIKEKKNEEILKNSQVNDTKEDESRSYVVNDEKYKLPATLESESLLGIIEKPLLTLINSQKDTETIDQPQQQQQQHEDIIVDETTSNSEMKQSPFFKSVNEIIQAVHDASGKLKSEENVDFLQEEQRDLENLQKVINTTPKFENIRKNWKLRRTSGGKKNEFHPGNEESVKKTNVSKIIETEEKESVKDPKIAQITRKDNIENTLTKNEEIIGSLIPPDISTNSDVKNVENLQLGSIENKEKLLKLTDDNKERKEKLLKIEAESEEKPKQLLKTKVNADNEKKELKLNEEIPKEDLNTKIKNPQEILRSSKVEEDELIPVNSLDSALKSQKLDSMVLEVQKIPPLIYDRALKITNALTKIPSNQQPSNALIPPQSRENNLEAHSSEIIRNQLSTNHNNINEALELISAEEGGNSFDQSHKKLTLPRLKPENILTREETKERREKTKQILGKYLENILKNEFVVGSSHRNNNFKNFGKVIPNNVEDYPGKSDSVLFLGSDVNLPLNAKKNEDGSYKLSLDLDKLCDCKENNCNRKRSSDLEDEERRRTRATGNHTGTLSVFTGFLEKLKELSQTDSNERKS